MDLLGNEFPYSSDALAKKHALIFGASKGIGAATAKMMAKAGADVTICARNENALNELCSTLRKLGEGNMNYRVIDLEDLASLPQQVDEIVDSLGGVDILVNNAGGPPGGPLLNNEIHDFIAPFQRHLHASHLIVKKVAPLMEKNNYGRIIQIISTLSLIHI